MASSLSSLNEKTKCFSSNSRPPLGEAGLDCDELKKCLRATAIHPYSRSTHGCSYDRLDSGKVNRESRVGWTRDEAKRPLR